VYTLPCHEKPQGHAMVDRVALLTVTIETKDR
jgi:hypothetical protein